MDSKACVGNIFSQKGFSKPSPCKHKIDRKNNLIDNAFSVHSKKNKKKKCHQMQSSCNVK
jgi:hypothetical protein